MGTVIETTTLVAGHHWRDRHSALRLAVKAARYCLHNAGRDASDVDLLINTGIYRDRNLGEPALAAMIQQDIGAHPEDPHPHAHGTFSFDIANGTCGILTALQIVDGFLRTHVIERALIVASDADPGHRMSANFPFTPAGAAVLCQWSDDDDGFDVVHWARIPDDGESFSADVRFVDRRNVLRVGAHAVTDERFAAAAAQAVAQCLDAAALDIAAIATIVVAPTGDRFRTLFAGRLGVPEDTVVAADHGIHTAALAGAFERATRGLAPGEYVLVVAAGAGVTAGAALYRMPRRSVRAQ